MERQTVLLVRTEPHLTNIFVNFIIERKPFIYTRMKKNDFNPEIIFTINFSELNIAERDNAAD